MSNNKDEMKSIAINATKAIDNPSTTLVDMSIKSPASGSVWFVMLLITIIVRLI